MFAGLRSRLMLSFSLLLLTCLSILTVVFVLFFFFWVSLPDLAYARLMDAALPMVAQIRELRRSGERSPEEMEALAALAGERGMRMLWLTMPGGNVVADTEGQWTGKQIRINLPADDTLPSVYRRGRLQSPDRRRFFYVAVALQPTGSSQQQALYVALAMPWWETARPFVGSLLASVAFSGVIAFGLSTLLALWLAKSLAAPLQRAAAAAELVAGGDYSASLDISAPHEARRLMDSFNAMIKAVETSQRSQRDFVSNVSHELKTPLTSIQGFAQAIVDGTASDDASICRAARVIKDEAERLTRMVNGLLDLARLESGQSALSWHSVDLKSLLSACVEQFALVAEDRDVRLALDLPEPVAVVGDGDRLMQVFNNLVDNGLKHTDPGGKVTLGVASSGDPSWVTVRVSDTGHGIPTEDLPRIFERFYQVDKSRSRPGDPSRSGVGLGLAIVSEIVRAHGGQVSVESIVGLGTQFTVTLPKAAQAES